MENKSNRREFLISVARAMGLASMGGLIWSGYLNEAKASALILRPPGAINEKDFLAKCIKCGLCVENCPFDSLKLAKSGDGLPIGTPFFVPREIPCYMCEDVPCVPPCPTGALDPFLISRNYENNKKLDIKMAKMGSAIIDSKSCVAYWGIQCDACYRACPLIGTAIKLAYARNERTGKHAFLTPEVDSDICTGCGLCEQACITKSPAIKILPREAILGSVDSTYIKGWDNSDEVRLKDAKNKINKNGGIVKESAESYLDNMEINSE